MTFVVAILAALAMHMTPLTDNQQGDSMTLRSTNTAAITADVATTAMNSCSRDHRGRCDHRHEQLQSLATRIEPRWRVDKGGRNRYRGQGKRGRMSTAAEESIYGRHAIEELEKALASYALAQRSPRGSYDRKAFEKTAVDHVAFAGRLVDDILLRKNRL